MAIVSGRTCYLSPYQPAFCGNKVAHMPGPKPIKRSSVLRIRVSDEEHDTVSAAAEHARLTLSSYVRMILVTQAEAQLHAAGKSGR